MWRGTRLHQHIHGLANQTERAHQDQDRNDDTRHRVGSVPSGHENHDARGDDADRAEEIREYV
jgi:hypothetical protein